MNRVPSAVLVLAIVLNVRVTDDTLPAYRLPDTALATR